VETLSQGSDPEGLPGLDTGPSGSSWQGRVSHGPLPQLVVQSERQGRAGEKVPRR
jgi:hypothetical protein